jgi:hypothetical protein
MSIRTVLGMGVVAGVVAASMIVASPASAVEPTIPAGAQSVTSLSPATGPLSLTPTFGGVVCPSESTQVAGVFFGGSGTGAAQGEIPESAPALAGAYVIGDPARFGFSINALIGSVGVAASSLQGRYAYKLTCIDDFGLPTPGATEYYALVNVTPTDYTFIPPAAPSEPTTTVLAASPTTAEQGSAVSLSATVSPSGAAAAGSVEFRNGATVLGTDTTPADGFTLTVNDLPVGTNNLTAVYSGSTGFQGSTSAPVAVTITGVAPRPTTTTIVSVDPVSGDAFTPTTIVCDVQAATGAAVGTLAFRANSSTLGTVPVSANGPVTFTTNAIGAGSAIAVGCAFTGTAPYENSASGTLPIERVLAGASDEQTVIVEIPVGAITITTPYTPDNPLDLGVAVLDQGDSTYSASAPFDRVTITDTRAGQLGFTASLVAGPFANGTETFPGQHAGFENVTAVQVAGNALQASNVTTTSTPAFTPGIGSPTVFATYPAGNALGSVEVTANFTVDQIPTSVAPGVYTSTVTFTAI